MSSGSGEAVYREVQRPTSKWYIGLFVVIALLAWAAFVLQIVRNKPIGSNPSADWGIWILTIILGVVFPIAFLSVKLEVSVFPDRVVIRWFPLANRTIHLSEIARVEARTYKPVREYGGWGIKIRPGNKMVYSISGNEGVYLTLRDGRRVMIGSLKAAELAAAISAQGIGGSA